MLQNLYVKNLALIEEIEIEFTDGLNILSGETGAGKSIILGSIGLAIGGRYPKDMIRTGAAYGLVELSFRISSPDLLAQLADLDILTDDGYLVLSRKLLPGRSVSKINGETVQMSTLKTVSALLLDIHGQHEHQTLLSASHQLAILDAYGAGVTALREAVSTAYRSYFQAEKALTAEREQKREVKKELEFYQFEVDEIENAALQDQEDVRLEARYQQLTHAQTIQQGLGEAYDCTNGSDVGAGERLSQGLRALGESLKYDGSLQGLYDQLADIDNLLNDFNRELADTVPEYEYDDGEFQELSERLNEINRLKAKYGSTIAEILAYQAGRQPEIAKLTDYEAYINGLEQARAETYQVLAAASEKLSRARRRAAQKLARATETELQDLNFAATKFAIQLGKKAKITEDGADEIEFQVSVNPGQPLMPLAQVASGGELSRIMLALKTVMADSDHVETLLFDEIDAGISGRTAQKVAEKMALIGRRHQVLAITHLPQITAMADTHFVIEKQVRNDRTTTGIRRLGEEECVQEIARLLGGVKVTENTLSSAREMKSLANQTKLSIIDNSLD